ncbi:unnamed protein product [Paramecium pentaurelia]|uniref:Transmembrane protein n=1 Tax=Paramecium pentaurelia TaxID=43138 RepID=A0A8S1WP48_9CILI|nr:unnamed protein product [Paramecium pentaurelia]
MFKLIFILCIILSFQKRIYYNRYEEDPINSYEKCQRMFCQDYADSCFSDQLCMYTQHNCFSKYYSKDSQNYKNDYYECIKSNIKAKVYINCMEIYCQQDLLFIYSRINKKN